jgi:hypothetical protein
MYIYIYREWGDQEAYAEVAQAHQKRPIIDVKETYAKETYYRRKRDLLEVAQDHPRVPSTCCRPARLCTCPYAYVVR